jgi:hypothetical protein
LTNFDLEQKQFGKQNALDVKTACNNINTKGMQSGESIQNYGFGFLKMVAARDLA